MLTLIQQILLGAIQGITEWLPISSSAATTLVLTNLFQVTSTNDLIKTALFLHLGTFLATLVYFRKDVATLLQQLINYRKTKNKQILNFLIISTFTTGILGALILIALKSITLSNLTAKTMTFAIATLLLITGILQLKTQKPNSPKFAKHIKFRDAIIVGLAQGLATLPGLSRSGTTISTLLLLKFDDTLALRLSFLMSLPVVIGANIILNLDKFTFSYNTIAGLTTSFILGIATIHIFIKTSQKINFAIFVLIFSALTYLSILFI
jgi:undecaprenyl-diphosphatase